MAPLALVTGASSGIGRAIAIQLGGLGYEVLAGVRSESDAPPGTEPVRLDVGKHRGDEQPDRGQEEHRGAGPRGVGTEAQHRLLQPPREQRHPQH